MTERAEPIEAEGRAPEVSGASTSGLATRYVAPSSTATLTDTELVQTAPPAPPAQLDSGDDQRVGQHEHPEQARGGRSYVLLRAGLAASTVGLCLLLFVGYVNTFTARAITSPITSSETIDCSAIVSFAQALIGMTSVGLNAVLVVTPRMR